MRSAFALAAIFLAGCPLETAAAPGGSGPPSPPPAANAWNEDVADAALDARSAARLAWLASDAGLGAPLALAFSIPVLRADATTVEHEFSPNTAFVVPDCDRSPFPLPLGGAVEGEGGYACTRHGGCRLVVLSADGRRYDEMDDAFDPPGATFAGGCFAEWGVQTSYAVGLRGDGCRAADASGLPLGLTTATPAEVARGIVAHALRLRVPPIALRAAYVHPATHAAGGVASDDRAFTTGTRVRLRAAFDFDSLPSDGARVLARALATRGAIVVGVSAHASIEVSDGRFGDASWSDVGVDEASLRAIDGHDFEIIFADPPSTPAPVCVR